MHGASDARFFGRFVPVYDPVMPPADPGALETVLDRADWDVERVVNISGGSGRATLALDVPERIALDRSAGMPCRARGRSLGCVRGDARKLPFVDNPLDAVTIVDAFHHMPNQRGAAEEVFRVLASGGVSAVNEFGPETLPGRGLVAAERVVGFGLTFATSDKPVRFLERVGFEVVVVERGFEYTVVGKKRESH